MTAGELIAVLQQHEPSARVLVDGYEGDYDDIAAIAVKSVVYAPSRSGLFGDYKDAEPGSPGISCVLLSRDRQQ